MVVTRRLLAALFTALCIYSVTAAAQSPPCAGPADGTEENPGCGRSKKELLGNHNGAEQADPVGGFQEAKANGP